MNEELTITAMNLFDSSEKWNSFCELMNRSNDIQARWWKRLQEYVYSKEKLKTNADWEIHIWNNWDIAWYLKDGGPKSIQIHFWGDGFRVYYNSGDLDIQKVNLLLQDSKFDAIKECFEKIDGSDFQTLAWEHRNFKFDTIFDGKFPDSKMLSWYAGNKTEDFAEQLLSKVRKFQTIEITALFREINDKCKK